MQQAQDFEALLYFLLRVHVVWSRHDVLCFFIFVIIRA